MIATCLDVMLPSFYPPSDGVDHAEGAEEESVGFSPDEEVLPGSASDVGTKHEGVSEVDLSPQNGDVESDLFVPERKRRRL